MKDVAGCPNSTVCIGIGNEYYRFGQYSEFLNPFACQVMHALTSFADLNVFHCSGRDSECIVFLWTKL